jgi:hypothetical protein
MDHRPRTIEDSRGKLCVFELWAWDCPLPIDHKPRTTEDSRGKLCFYNRRPWFAYCLLPIGDSRLTIHDLPAGGQFAYCLSIPKLHLHSSVLCTAFWRLIICDWLLVAKTSRGKSFGRYAFAYNVFANCSGPFYRK